MTVSRAHSREILRGMSSEDVEIFRRAIDALNRADVEAIPELADPEVVLEPLRAPVSGAYIGHQGMRQFFADTAETFGRFWIELDDVRDLGDDRVLVLGTMHARVRLGGLETEATTAGIATFRDGRVIHWKDLGDRAKAVEAAGFQS